MHEEIVLRYNNPVTTKMKVHEVVGGCFTPDCCQCGALFCHGATLRRMSEGYVLPSDRYCFDEKDGTLLMDVELMERANDVGRIRFAGTADPTEPAKCEDSRMSVWKILAQGMGELRKIHPTTLLNLYNRQVQWDETPEHLRVLLVEDGVVVRRSKSPVK